MLFIAQEKSTKHFGNNKDILANTNVNLKPLLDYFVHQVASSKSIVSRN